MDVGTHQVKWLHKIKLSSTPLIKLYQCKSYLGFAPGITFGKDFSKWPPSQFNQALDIDEQPATLFVCDLPQNSVIEMRGDTDFIFKGMAWNGGGRKVKRVGMSVDGGESSTTLELYKPIE